MNLWIALIVYALKNVCVGRVTVIGAKSGIGEPSSNDALTFTQIPLGNALIHRLPLVLD